mgnify:CR=1 FL=1
MTARTHDAIGFTALVTVAVFYPPATITVLTLFSSFVANVVGSLLPDIDQATNRLWDMLPAGNEVGKNLRGLFLHHRTITHSLLGLLLAYKFFGWLLPQVLNPTAIDVTLVYWSLLIGYVSHLAADVFTKDGIPLLFPLQWKFGIPPIKSLRVTTGNWVENFLVLPGTGAYLLWFIWTHQADALLLVRRITIG